MLVKYMCVVLCSCTYVHCICTYNVHVYDGQPVRLHLCVCACMPLTHVSKLHMCEYVCACVYECANRYRSYTDVYYAHAVFLYVCWMKGMCVHMFLLCICRMCIVCLFIWYAICICV